jgi:hypothetical protein
MWHCQLSYNIAHSRNGLQKKCHIEINTIINVISLFKIAGGFRLFIALLFARNTVGILTITLFKVKRFN